VRVLAVTSVPPLPEGGAAARCVVALLRGLDAHGVETHVLCPTDSHGFKGKLPEDLSVEIVQLPRTPRWRGRWERLVAPRGELAGEPFASRLRERASEVDLVHFVEAEPAAALGHVSCPALVQLHCLTRRDSRVWNPLRAQGRASIELLRAETRARKRARWLLANSVEVGEVLAAGSPRAEVVVAPLALDPSSYAPAAELQAPIAGLIGTARWPPTANAVERLLRSVWPRVLERQPEARLALAGEGMQRATFAHLPEHPGVEWRGPVPSASDFLRELGLLLYPLTAGSGAKVKVLEALALGLPVVTTPDGAEGLGGRGGVAVETDDGLLAAAAAGLLGDVQARRVAGRAALETFTEHHTPVRAAVPVLELYRQMIA
jgi:glycosyltransferase involved in cell wall biosynthesis